MEVAESGPANTGLLPSADRPCLVALEKRPRSQLRIGSLSQRSKLSPSLQIWNDPHLLGQRLHHSRAVSTRSVNLRLRMLGHFAAKWNQPRYVALSAVC